MVNIENIQNEILNALKPLHLDKVILFGSYAYGVHLIKTVILTSILLPMMSNTYCGFSFSTICRKIF
ncbi:hypothetical protein GSY74_01525 [Sulfurovum sp. bin170]|uniref:hypothetical protein n=1 Tax=Sulfurovum sp. bin170 TaxID=2695268 RepID=UPI0013DF3AC4|nr:hypothetical protein [Sulfurovum sp. bin170]NEW59950.1 hypothetical protein [Sulfurovum sp. bin170]